MKLPPPMKSFLKQYDLSGKTIVPFNTNDGYGIGSSFETVKDYVQIAKYWKALLSKEEWKEMAELVLVKWKKQKKQKRK